MDGPVALLRVECASFDTLLFQASFTNPQTVD